MEWYRKAAEQGHPLAQRQLGICYERGDGVGRDLSNNHDLAKKLNTEAVPGLQILAEQGNAVAQNNLGDCYYDGEGVTQDYAKAIEWYRKAVEQGDAYAQYNLGYCYYNGKGVAKNSQKGIEWYEKAAAAGSEDAEDALKEIRRERNIKEMNRSIANFKKKYGFDPSIDDVRYIVKVGRNILHIIVARNNWLDEYSDDRNAKILVGLVKDQGTSKCYKFYSRNGAYFMGYFWTRNNIITSIQWR